MKLYKIKKSKIDNKGRGLYAAKDIKEGTKIIRDAIIIDFLSLILV